MPKCSNLTGTRNGSCQLALFNMYLLTSATEEALSRYRVLMHQQQWADICWIPLGLFAAVL